MNDAAKKQLRKMLEGYQQGLPKIMEYIEKTKEQLEDAQKKKVEAQNAIYDIKDALGIE